MSPDPDRTPAPAAEVVKSSQATDDGYFIPRVPSSNSCLTDGELRELRDLLQEFRDRFNDGTRPLSATNLLKARLDTGNTTQMSFLPRALVACGAGSRATSRCRIGRQGNFRAGGRTMRIAGGYGEEVVRDLEVIL